jgi:hypothetical protein
MAGDGEERQGAARVTDDEKMVSDRAALVAK